MKALRLTFFFLAFFGVAFLAGAGYWAFSCFRATVAADAVLLVGRGASVRQIAELLENNKVIKNRYFFEAYVRVINPQATLKIGEYEFFSGESMVRVFEKLSQGETKKYTFVIPEGVSLRDICRNMVSRQMIDLITCLDLVSDTTKIKEFVPETTRTLEGYLFPDTYTYDALVTQQEFIDSMVALFFKRLGKERLKKVNASGKTLHDVVILASIVEKETGKPEERPLIAGVFLNRLRLGMPLQSDPTVIYWIPQFNGNLTKKDLQTDTPYNTYTRKGLPAGPIGNPGLAAIDAVLNPATTDALYFVAKGDGSHYFSRSLEEHNRAVQYYQLKRGAPPSPKP